MAQHRTNLPELTLYSDAGERKYLTAAERVAFLDAAARRPDPLHHTFCAMLHWTGCRPSEARGIRAMHIDRSAQVIVLQSLKKRGAAKGRTYRAVPVPPSFLDLLSRVHDLDTIDHARLPSHRRLWPFSRTTAWRIVNEVMIDADLSGAKASAKGLRHAYGVHAAMTHVPLNRIKVWLGHTRLETTEIYLDVAAPEDRTFAERMW